MSQIESIFLGAFNVLKEKVLAGTFQNLDFIDRQIIGILAGRAESVLEYYSYGPCLWMFLFVGVPQ